MSLAKQWHNEANGKMRACMDVGLQFRVSRVRVRDKATVSVRDRVGVRVSNSVRVSTFYFCHTSSPQKPASPHFTHSPKQSACIHGGSYGAGQAVARSFLTAEGRGSP